MYEKIPLEDGTKYWFEQTHMPQGFTWYVCCLPEDSEKSLPLRMPYNKGKFDAMDYSLSFGTTYWDWFKITRPERIAMRRYWMHKTDHQPMSVSDFRKAFGVIEASNYLVPTAPETPPAVKSDLNWKCPVIEENTMYPEYTMKTTASTINISPAATASMTTESDASLQRKYLMKRLSGIESAMDWGPKDRALRDQFHIGVDNTPKTFAALLAAITGGKYTLDAKKMALLATNADEDDDGRFIDRMDPFYGVIWDGPVSDRAGYEAAKTAFYGAVTDTKDTITIMDPTAGLASLKALEAWTPPAGTIAS